MTRRDDNFDFVRFAAALTVLYGHSAVLTGRPNTGLWGMPVSAVAVFVFFAISGYLVTGSWLADPRCRAFLARRALRLFPALFVCVAVSAVAIGLFITPLAFADYVADRRFSAYLGNAALIMSYELPGVFTRNPYPAVVNGSLWTLPVEALCYMAVPLFGLRHRGFIALALLSAMLAAQAYFYYLNPASSLLVLGTSPAEAAMVMPYFFCGAVLRIAEPQVPARLVPALILSALMWGLEGVGLTAALPWVGVFAIPYAAIAFGRASMPVLRRWARYGDFSYGFYLYAFPLQQTLVQVCDNRLGFAEHVLVSAAAAFACAAASWFCVERPALAFKPDRLSH